MRSLLRQTLARIRGFLRPADGVEDFDEELAIHLEMAVEDKIRQGLSPAEARRQARVELGNLTQLRDAARNARGLPWIGASWLDVKLGVRRLRRTWGLTLVAGLAMTVVIGIGAVAFDVLATFGDTALPLDEGERVVVLQSWDPKTSVGTGVAPADFQHWRATLRSVEDLGAFRTLERNLSTRESIEEFGPAETVEVAEITASGFALARVAPVLGRPLLAEDELPSAEPVVVVGHEVWRSRLGSDPGVLGRRIRLDGRVHTVVGVMPEGFGFPLYHRYWTPLRATELTSAVGNDDTFVVFARLEPGVTLDSASRELRRVGLVARSEAAIGSGPAELRVVPYVIGFTGELDNGLMPLALLFVALLLVPPCINIAVLVYARTVAREGELAARYVLGAGRFHIVSQLFVEILVLAVGAGIVAIGLARMVVWQMVADFRGRGDSIPFWMDFELSARTVLFVAALAVLAAVIAGVLPALQATGRRLQSGLRTLGGQTAPRLGGAWTALIVLQVAFSFALLPSSVEMTWGTLRSGLLGPGFAAEEYLTATLEPGRESFDGEAAGDRAALFRDRRQSLVRLLVAEPAVAAVATSSAVPGDEPWLVVESEARLEVNGATTEGGAVGSDRVARVNHVDPEFFEIFELPILTGRGFAAGDFATRHSATGEPAAGSRSVVVNQTFVADVLGGGNPLGRRIRYRTLDEENLAFEIHPERWFEIVGVVADLHRNASAQTVYHPASPGHLASPSLALRLRTDPNEAADLLRQVTWGLDPSLRLTQIRRLDEIYRQKAVGDYLGASGLVAATVSVLLLSAAGIYALMLFTFNRRRKEIGIRLALGARPMGLLVGVFGRALGGVGVGAGIGVGIALLVGHYIPIAALGGWEVRGIIPAATLFIVAVAGLALSGPAHRALRVQPIEELREG